MRKGVKIALVAAGVIVVLIAVAFGMNHRAALAQVIISPSTSNDFANATCTGCTMPNGTFADASLTGSPTLNGQPLLTSTGILSGTTGSMGGSLLSVGSCATGTATVTGATTGMVAVANPTTYQGDGVQFQAYVSATNTVTVKACALILITPAATTYKVRVLP